MEKALSILQYEVLFALESGERLTVQKCFRIFHTTELRKIVSRLRQRGYDIRATRKFRDAADGRKVWFNEYFLAQPVQETNII